MTENKEIERKLLYQTTEFCMGEDGMLWNPHNKPLRNIIYEIAKEFSRKTQECEILQQSENEAKEIIAELKAEKEQAEQKLEKIKPILEYYANTCIGVRQSNGTYRYDLNDGYCIFYDPRKAEEGLKIIDEVE